MLVLADTIEIARPAEAVFAFVSHLENYPDWFPGVVQMRSADDLPDGTIGKRYNEIAVVPPGREEAVSVEIAEFERGRRLVIHPDLAPVLPKFTYEVVERGAERTEFRWRCEARARGASVALAFRLMRAVLRPRLRAGLGNLKRILEQSPEQKITAALQWRFGPPQEVLRVNDTRPRLPPGPGEVRVRILAASLNHIDVMRMSGYGARLFRIRKAGGFPLTLGTDVCGVVEAVGSGVSGCSAGDMVFGAKPPSRDGTLASHVILAAEHVVAVPEGLSPESAAAMPYCFLTAWAGLVGQGPLSDDGAGDARVFVQGGAGGVGSMAVQIAKALGAHVAASCRAHEVEAVQALGADEVHPVGSSDYAASLRDYDIALCSADPSEFDRMLGILKKGGGVFATTIHPTLALVDKHGLLLGPIKAKRVLAEQRREASKLGVGVQWVLFQPNRAALERLAGWAGQGRIRPILDRHYPLRDIAAAMIRLASGEARGKVIIHPDTEQARLKEAR
ncbi:MAG: zinc-binding dehydrogenase [Alphaproteobacteria bacterium]|nr:zinc-binding dehydrogenase [Alphaproteobacteria bacterium]